LVENPFKKCVFLHFLSNKCIVNSYFWENPITLIKRKRFYRWALFFFSFFFRVVVCYESQTWGSMAVEKMYIIYIMHIDFIQSSSSNHWIKFNFDFKWALSSKILSCTCLGFSKDAIKISIYCIPIIFVLHHFFGWKMVHP